MTVEETHPYNCLKTIPAGTLLLIIGTAPPQRFSQPRIEELNPGDVDFYYGSKDNQLWSVIFPDVYRDYISPTSSEDIREARRRFLIRKKIWMHDICETYSRTKNNASDTNLKPSNFADLRQILEERAAIHTLIFTGGLAEKWSGIRMEEQGLIRSGQFWMGTRKKTMPRQRRFEIKLDNALREIEMYTLPSPSYASARVYSNNHKIEAYRNVLLRLN